MEKLIITVTVDSTASYPANPYCPPVEQVEKVAEQYVGAVKAGASIAHHHGVHRLEEAIQEDGRKLSRIDFDGWKRLTELIRQQCDVLMQFGIASARQEEKFRLMDLKPEMMSICCNAHDEYFQPDPSTPANEIYSVHPHSELRAYAKKAREKGVKLELESFHTGAFLNIQKLVRDGLLDTPIWTTLFLGWPGGSWTPPTAKALNYLLDYLPEGANWSLSVMDPEHQWPMLAHAIARGGNVRVGWEDNPYLSKGVYAKTNAELVERVVQIAEGIGREIATPAEARKIVGLEH
jgi:3-keto-5-aminohexanoate cleavage enzyme